ncbi:hypothetical protein ACS0TY_032329 [Phlomoides rotata]
MWKLQKWFNVGGEKKLNEAAKAFDDFINPLVSLKNVEDDDLSVLRAFRKVYEEKSMGAGGDLRGFLKDTALNLMFAGRDTTSTCLTWLFWLIAVNPCAENKIREEIETELKLKEDNKKWRFFNVQESRKLRYLHGALCESLRLFPTVALEHNVEYPTSVENGERVGKRVLRIQAGEMDYSERRVETRAVVQVPGVNAGPRTCLGKEMAFVQMKMVAATIMYHYNIQLVEGHPVLPRDSIILQARHGLKVRLSKRN